MKRPASTAVARLRRRAALLVPIVAIMSAAALVAHASRSPPSPPLPPEAHPGDAETGGALTSIASSPLRGMAAPTGEAPTEGVVVEHLDAGPYSYLRIHPGAGRPDAWVATLGDGAPLGARVSVRSLGSRSDFPSRRLGRVFPRLDFAIVTTLSNDLEVIR